MTEIERHRARLVAEYQHRQREATNVKAAAKALMQRAEAAQLEAARALTAFDRQIAEARTAEARAAIEQALSLLHGDER